LLRELVMLKINGKPPLATGRKRSGEPTGLRHDGKEHWIVPTENNKNGTPSRRNCKQCHLEGKKERKATFKCEKCDAPLHVLCFKKYHMGVM
jgi:ubiquitin